MPPETATAERPAPANPITAIQVALDRRLPALEAFLPSEQMRQRFLRIVYQAVQKNPALEECTPQSIAAAAVEAAMYGLEPSGAAGGAHLVPFRDRKAGITEAQLIVDYRGQLQLARDSERVEDAFAELVYKADHFVWDAANQRIEHLPNLEVARGAPFAPENPVTHVYAVVVHKSGYRRPVVMTTAEVEQVRSISRAANGPAWTGHWGEMSKKTAMHRALKTAPLRPGAKAILDRDPDFDFDSAQRATVEPMPSQKPALADRLRERRQLSTTQPEQADGAPSDEHPAPAPQPAPSVAGDEGAAEVVAAAPSDTPSAETARSETATAQAGEVAPPDTQLEPASALEALRTDPSADTLLAFALDVLGIQPEEGAEPVTLATFTEAEWSQVIGEAVDSEEEWAALYKALPAVAKAQLRGKKQHPSGRSEAKTLPSHPNAEQLKAALGQGEDV